MHVCRAGFRNQNLIRNFWSLTKKCKSLFKKLIRNYSQVIRTFIPYALNFPKEGGEVFL